MGAMRRMGEALGLVERSEPPAEGPLPGVIPPARGSATVTADTALSIIEVYRAIQIHTTAAMQLSIDVERNGELIPTPSLIRKPCLDMSRSAFVEVTVSALGLTGNAFWKNDFGSDEQIINRTPLNPHDVTVTEDHRGKVTIWHDGKPYTKRQISHLQLMRVPGRIAGLGPIQAARAALAGVMDVRDYAAGWFRDGQAQPSGVLSTDQTLTVAKAREYKQMWNATADGGVRVLGAGLTYAPILLSPEDAQWIEARRFDTLGVARLMGAPASLMLVGVDGGSQTYQNVEQDWIGYARFMLMRYLREIEEALSDTLPRGQEARFNVEALLRTDTLTRYQAHQLALDPLTGWMRPSEVRRVERLPVLEGIDDVRPVVAAGTE